MFWAANEVGCRCHFHDFAQIHNHDPTAEVLDDSEVVSDEEVRDSVLLLKIVQQIDDLCLDGYIESADRFVANDQFRFDCQRSRDTDALTLAAAELVRVTVHSRRVKPNRGQQRPNSFAPRSAGSRQMMDVQRFADNGLDGLSRVQ